VSDFSNFRAIYDVMTDEVLRSRHQFFPDHLKNWFETIDTTRGVSELVSNLELSVDFKSWFENAQKSHTGMAGSGKLDWPKDREQRLGMQLALFRAMSRDEVDPITFCLNFLFSGTNLNDNISGLTDQLFRPMACDLRRYLEEHAKTAEGQIPASDRIVKLDHNNPKYIDLINALDDVQNALEAINDYDDAEDKDQRLTEISAGKTLLQSVRVRAEATRIVLGNALRYLARKFVDTAVGKAAGIAIKALCAYFGFTI
jgi:hypothetical protein